ncbi:cadmium-transporting ATPase [Halobacteriales archaeon QS_1_68_20]|nr:MAG: cadmium-transporting ATPase [Halobacteriales archaeon QS_1_68_20]
MTDDGDQAASAGPTSGASSGPGDVEAVVLAVPEMDCPSCASTVETAAERVPGVESVETSPTQGKAFVRTLGEDDVDDVVDVVEQAGYGVEAVGDEGVRAEPGDIWRSRRAVLTGASAAFLAVALAAQYLLGGADVLSVPGGSLSVGDLLMLGAALAGGSIILQNGWGSVRTRSLDMDLLMSAAIVAAVGGSLFATELHLYFEAATLAVLFNVAELLERYSVDRARGSLSELVALSPTTATVRRDGERTEVPADSVAVGDVVVVEPGEKVPVDGEVVEGASAVDESPITGESVPVDKAVGEEVFAGSINEEGFLAAEATAAGSDTTLSRVVELVEQAESDETRREQFVDRFAGYYTPAVVTAALLTATVPTLLGGAWEVWFVRGIALLVIACPCAFVISTPVSVVSGITSAARNGVLVKGGSHLERMGEVDCVAFDKTGTLTKGELAVTDVVPVDADEADLLAAARGLELRSEHPIGGAIVRHADERDVSTPEISGFESITGKGVRADLDGRTHYAGNPSLFEDLGFDLDGAGTVTDGGTAEGQNVGDAASEGDENLLDVVARLQSAGKTVVLVGTDGRLLGAVAVADEVRPEARDVVAELRASGVETVMLTGDNERTARAVADEVGVDDYRAGLLPEEKVEAVEALQAGHDGVAMVGDGVNDAPALATADVGVAMGAAGTDAAIETADVALMGDDLRKVPYLHRLARTANGVIRGNIGASLAVKAALAIGVPLGYVSVVVAVLAGDVGMTVAVTGNAARLARVRP